MEDSHPIRNSIIGVVVGSVVLAILEWLWGFASLVLRAVAGFSGWLAGVLGVSLEIPVWLLMLTVAPAAVVASRYFIGSKHKSTPRLPATDPEVADKVERGTNLTEVEALVFFVLVRGDGASYNVDELVRITESNRLRTTAALERLQERDLVTDIHDPFEGTQYMLTRRGRDLAIERDMA